MNRIGKTTVRRALSLSAVLLILATFSAARGQAPGDVGTFQCRATQIAIQNAVTAGEPYRNHGELMRTVSGLVNDAVNSAVITQACGQYILNQFARQIPVADQTPSGANPVCGDGACTPGETFYSCQVDCGASTVMGVSTIEIPRSDSCGNSAGRICESLVGNVTADAMRTTYSVNFAITNSGSLRDALTCPLSGGSFCPLFTPPPYPITRGQVFSVLPFGNLVVTLNLNGAELKSMLENGVSQMPAVAGRFPQVSGLCFTYDISAPTGSRVTGAVRQAADGSCTGPAIDMTAASTYTLAENDFMASGGDGYPFFIGRTTTHGIMDQVVADYVFAHTPISPTINGRITCTTSGATAYPVP